MIGKFSHVAERPLQIKKRPAFIQISRFDYLLS